MGRLVRDPEIRRTNSGKAVCSFTIACDKPGKDTGASFIDCVAWEKTADFIGNYFMKGSMVVLEGRLESRQYETKDNQKRTVLEVVVSQAHFCERKKEEAPTQTTGNFELLTDADEQLPF
jgi:single-strand DNA-binding protein